MTNPALKNSPKAAKDKGYTDTIFFADGGITGTTMKRPGFQKKIVAIGAEYISAAFAKDIFRLGKNYIKAGKLTDEFSHSMICGWRCFRWRGQRRGRR